MEVPAVHAGLPGLRGVGRRERRPGHRLAARARRLRRHPADVRLRPGLLPRRPRLVRQAVHVRGVAADAVRCSATRAGRRRRRASTASSPTSTWPRRSSTPRRRAAPADAGPQLLARPGRRQTLPPAAEGMYYRYWENDDMFHKAPAHYGYRTDRYKIIYFYNDGARPARAPARSPTRRSGSCTTSSRPGRAEQRLRRPCLQRRSRAARSRDVAGAGAAWRRPPPQPATSATSRHDRDSARARVAASPPTLSTTIMSIVANSNPPAGRSRTELLRRAMFVAR